MTVENGFHALVLEMTRQIRLSSERHFPPQHREMLERIRDDLVIRLQEYRRAVRANPPREDQRNG